MTDATPPESPKINPEDADEKEEKQIELVTTATSPVINNENVVEKPEQIVQDQLDDEPEKSNMINSNDLEIKLSINNTEANEEMNPAEEINLENTVENENNIKDDNENVKIPIENQNDQIETEMESMVVDDGTKFIEGEEKTLNIYGDKTEVDEMKTEVNDEMKTEVNDEMKTEIDNEIITEVDEKTEADNEIKTEVGVESKNEIKMKVENENVKDLELEDNNTEQISKSKIDETEQNPDKITENNDGIINTNENVDKENDVTTSDKNWIEGTVTDVKDIDTIDVTQKSTEIETFIGESNEVSINPNLTEKDESGEAVKYNEIKDGDDEQENKINEDIEKEEEKIDDDDNIEKDVEKLDDENIENKKDEDVVEESKVDVDDVKNENVEEVDAEKEAVIDISIEKPDGVDIKKPSTEKIIEQDASKEIETEKDQFTPRVGVETSTVKATTGENLVDLKNTTATVKFRLLPSEQVSTKRCGLLETISRLKAKFAEELRIPVSVIVLRNGDSLVEDDMTLSSLGVGPNGIVELQMTSSDPLNAPLRQLKQMEEYQMPDILTVRVLKANGELQDVIVEIERNFRKKVYLGGFRHKKTGVEYHNAACQTTPKARPPHPIERFCRDSQTVEQRHIVQQTNNSTTTQMTKVGVYVSNNETKLIAPGKYTTADEFLAKRLKNIVVIQKYYRRWLAVRYVENVKEDKEKRLEWERLEELRKQKEKEDRVKREYDRRMNPKCKEDFDLLYHGLEKWRQEELEKINTKYDLKQLTAAERKAALCQLMEQETELITSINRHKLAADSDKHDKIIQKLLEKAASSKKWKGPNGQITEMDTPYTLRAQELRDIYNSVSMRYLTQDERLDVLLTLKHTVKEHDCKLTREIVELIDREADLLMRGVKDTNLEGLRKRISTLFLQYIKTPTFNPEIARHLKVPQDASTLRGNVFYCPSCKQYLPSMEFALSSKSAMGACRKCRATDNVARTRHDYSYYRSMLVTLRKAEESFKDGSQVAFLLQDSDLRYLVENIWNAQSALSAWDDLYDLVLVRWIGKEHWSPWNCVLLTKEEAAAHEKLERLEEAYGKAMLHKVHQRHTIARNYFSRLPKMVESLKMLYPPREYKEKSEKIIRPRVTSVKI